MTNANSSSGALKQLVTNDFNLSESQNYQGVTKDTAAPRDAGYDKEVKLSFVQQFLKDQ